MAIVLVYSVISVHYFVVQWEFVRWNTSVRIHLNETFIFASQCCVSLHKFCIYCTVSQKNYATFICGITLWNIGRFWQFSVRKIVKQLDLSDSSFGHLTLIVSLLYLVKCRSCSLAVCNKEFILASACISSENH